MHFKSGDRRKSQGIEWYTDAVREAVFLACRFEINQDLKCKNQNPTL